MIIEVICPCAYLCCVCMFVLLPAKGLCLVDTFVFVFDYVYSYLVVVKEAMPLIDIPCLKYLFFIRKECAPKEHVCVCSKVNVKKIKSCCRKRGVISLKHLLVHVIKPQLLIIWNASRVIFFFFN